jgi:hypothetical protein
MLQWNKAQYSFNKYLFHINITSIQKKEKGGNANAKSYWFLEQNNVARTPICLYKLTLNEQINVINHLLLLNNFT